MGTLQTAARIFAYLQEYMRTSCLGELRAVPAAAILDRAGLLDDSQSRPGKPLRDLLRAGAIRGAYQVPNRPYGGWHIPLLPG